MSGGLQTCIAERLALFPHSVILRDGTVLNDDQDSSRTRAAALRAPRPPPHQAAPTTLGNSARNDRRATPRRAVTLSTVVSVPGRAVATHWCAKRRSPTAARLINPT